jgi:hypothetical protein
VAGLKAASKGFSHAGKNLTTFSLTAYPERSEKRSGWYLNVVR